MQTNVRCEEMVGTSGGRGRRSPPGAYGTNASERDVIAVKSASLPRLSPCTLFGHPCICSWKAPAFTTKSLTCARGKRRLYLSRKRRWLAGSVVDHPLPRFRPPHTATNTPLPPTYAHTQCHGHSQQHAAKKEGAVVAKPEGASHEEEQGD